MDHKMVIRFLIDGTKKPTHDPSIKESKTIRIKINATGELEDETYFTNKTSPVVH